MNSCKFAGAPNAKTRRILFSSFVYQLFAWLFALVPLFTTRQQTDLSHAYYTCVKRVYRCLRSLEMRCIRYWERYGKALSKLEDGQLLLEQLELCTHRQSCLNGHNWIWALRRNRRFINRDSVLGACLGFWTMNKMEDSIPVIIQDELDSFAIFSESY